MDPITQQVVLATAGAAGAGEATYVDDVFSAFLYEGNGSARTIANGIDLSGEGGLVWIKQRTSSFEHALSDTERGVQKYLRSNTNQDETDRAPSGDNDAISSFNSDGFSLGGSLGVFNASGHDYVSWTFRKAPGFFDVVTWTGNGTSGRTINHNLGSVPGMIIVKCVEWDGTSWAVWHRSLTSGKVLFLDTTGAEATQSYFPSQPTATNFTIGSSAQVNTSYGFNYVAYVFAHDDQSFGTDEDEAIIKCGSYTGNGSTDGPEVNLGFEPQFLLYKNVTQALNWEMIDVWRGMPRGTSSDYMKVLKPNTDAAESTDFSTYPTSTGFKITNNGGSNNASGNTYIYMAIRRPHKPPTAGTDVFKSVLQSTHPQTISVGFPTDLIFTRDNTNASNNYLVPRLTGRYLATDLTNAEGSGSSFLFDLQNSFSFGTWWGSGTVINYYFKRAPGFFDVVTYTGNGSARTIAHNLSSVPEMMIFKTRSDSSSWIVYHKSTGAANFLVLNDVGGATTASAAFNDTEPTASVFTLGNGAGVNGSTKTFVGYLFASLDGISKVGSYTGTGNDVNVDCGFTAGARFILIRRTDSGGWYVWDSTRGIVSGNDPYFLLNVGNAPVTNTDYIDPLNAGFTVTSSAPAALNTSGGTYLFLAIA